MDEWLQLSDILKLKSDKPEKSSVILYYEDLPFDIQEYENKDELWVIWLSPTLEEQKLPLLLPKNSRVKDLHEELKKVYPPVKKIRVMNVESHRITRLLPPDDLLVKILGLPGTIYAEEIPEAEIHKLSSQFLVQVAHFNRCPFLQNIGTPFLLLVDERDTPLQLKNKIKQRSNAYPPEEIDACHLYVVKAGKPQALRDCKHPCEFSDCFR